MEKPNVRVTIVLQYQSESAGPDPASIDQQAFNAGHFDIPELLEWVEEPIDGDVKVTFENI